MGLNLNSVYQRPYFIQDRRNQVRKKQDEERSTSSGQKKTRRRALNF